MTPVGVFKSCFACRNGTPRQGALVPTSLGLVRLEDKIGGPGSKSGAHKHFDGPAGQALKGLDGFSHVWIIWAFDQYYSKNRSPVVKPPRLGGDSIGVFACRSPKRPNPIGMTAAKIERVDPSAATILVSGIDLLDGTPILDIKPYIPTYDSFPGAAEPDWLSAPAAPTTVTFDAGAAAALGELASGSELFPSPEAVEETIRSVLASDPRSRISRKHKTQTYAFTLDGLRVRCSFEEGENGLDVRVTDVSLGQESNH